MSRAWIESFDHFRYSALETPLTFLTDDILLTMCKSQKNYFKLNKENALDNKENYFLFAPCPSPDNPNVMVYQYQKSSNEYKNEENC